MNHRIKAGVSGFDGTRSYGPGDVVEVDLDHARRATLRGHGALVDDSGRKVPIAKAIEALRVPDDDIVRIETSDKGLLAVQDRIKSEKEG